MAAYVVFTREKLRDQAAMATYSGLAGPSMAGHEVKALSVYGKCESLEGAPIDTQFRISDEEGLYWVARLLKEEGLCLGLSSGINVAGAVALGKQLGPGKRVVTILCDTGFRYLSSLYNRDWLEEKGLPVFDWLG